MITTNCRPGDLAYIASMQPLTGLNGRPVQLQDSAPIVVNGVLCWRLEKSLRYVTPMQSRVLSGHVVEAGRTIQIDTVADYCLKPIRDPGVEAVDQMVKLAGPAPMTAAEAIAWGQA